MPERPVHQGAPQQLKATLEGTQKKVEPLERPQQLGAPSGGLLRVPEPPSNPDQDHKEVEVETMLDKDNNTDTPAPVSERQVKVR